MSWSRWSVKKRKRAQSCQVQSQVRAVGPRKAQSLMSPQTCRQRRVGTRMARQEMPQSLRLQEKESLAVLKGNLETRGRM